MDTFELVVQQRHFNEWIGIKAVAFVYEPFQVAHEVGDFRLRLRRGINSFAKIIFLKPFPVICGIRHCFVRVQPGFEVCGCW